ncbi:C10orf76 [Cordylochernes scorpioides]|uniref:C10orf76 n=1 Tax=Cordylochernes scorpioides TaxID=51811 RepID=A0ABY6JXG5_9ARAC|nr:C10orf76 [Cordylochernes scorpioides]
MLAGLLTGLHKCKKAGNSAFDKIDFLISFDSAETLWQNLIENINSLLLGETSSVVKSSALNFLLALVTATDNVSENFLLEYLMMNSIFETFIKLLTDNQARANHGYQVTLIMTIIINYRKFDSTNPYIIKLSIVDNLVALNGYGQVLSHIFSEFNKDFGNRLPPTNTSFLSSLTQMVGSMFVPEETNYFKNFPKINMASLLALYEAVHLNRNFINTLTHSQTDSGSFLKNVDPCGDGTTEVDCTSPPANLLTVFLETCSILVQNVREEADTAKLCFIILTCICEDQFANSIMHDMNVLFKVTLHQMPMRHRKLPTDRSGPSRSLAAALLDLMVEFIHSHMMRSLPVDLYLRALTIVHRLISYQKRCRIRLPFSWHSLWSALINLLKFVQTHEADFVKEFNIFLICSKVVNIFNLFITFGDTFLPSPVCYDELYYEIIRMHEVFDNLHTLALRYSTLDNPLKECATSLCSNLVNLRALVAHYTAKIDQMAANSNPSHLSETAIMEIIRTNYDTLTLKLQDTLDQVDRYTEKPKETAFFHQLVKEVIVDARQNLNFQSPTALYSPITTTTPPHHTTRHS